MDCDLQDSPEEIPNLLLKTKEGFHIVVARRGKRQDPAPKVMLSWLFYKTLGIFLARRIDPEVGNFRIISRQVANDFRRIGDRVRIFSVIVDWLGYPQAAVSVKHGTRPSGKSSYTFRKLCKLALDSLLVNLDRVIIWWAALGFLAAFLALIYGTYIFISWWISPSPIIGWTSTILSVTLFGGLNMLLLGIVGLYVGKTFEESRNRPLYIVCEATNAQNLIKNSACGPRTN
jgi:dolichol-phosphate mannosyltransferase